MLYAHFHISSAVDLGIDMWQPDQLHPPEIVPITTLSGHFACAKLRHSLKHYWVTMSVCHVRFPCVSAITTEIMPLAGCPGA